jgi:hypothetical protein
MSAQQRMASAIFAVGLSIACHVVAGLSPRTDELRRLEASMSVDDALQRLNGELPSEIATLVGGWHLDSAKSKKLNIIALQKSSTQDYDRKGASDKKTVDEARQKMNGMIEETQEKLDKREVQCEADIKISMAVIEETSSDMSLYQAQNTKAKEDHLRAEGTINSLGTTRTKLDDELKQSEITCTNQIQNLNAEIAVMINDSIILQKILGMIDCPKTTSLVQCNDTRVMLRCSSSQRCATRCRSFNRIRSRVS